MEKEIELEQEAIVVYSGGGAVNSVNGYTGDVVLTTSDLENTSDYQTGTEVESAISTAIAGKQDTLTAGNNITISNNTISATDTTYSAGTGLTLDGTQFSVDTNTIATQQDVSNEATARENADTNLQGQIDAISASSDVTDIVGTYAALQAYDTTHLKDNDIIKVLQDESQNDETTYYRWSTSTQTFTLIGEEGPYYTKSQTDTLLQAKQDTLTAGSNITIGSDNTISATDTTYTAGSGLNLTGATFSVDTSTIATQADLDTKQDVLTAGQNIHITDESGNLVISADGTTYTAGEAIDITNDVISATNTGKAKVLTTADYNYPTNNPNGVALWTLGPGMYYNGNNVKMYTDSTNSYTISSTNIITVSGNIADIATTNYNSNSTDIRRVDTSNGSLSSVRTVLSSDNVANNLTTTSYGKVLDARQGKVLKDLIDSIPTPTTYTAGTGLDLTGTEFSVDFNDVQGKLTAGQGISIADESGDLVISATSTGPNVVQTTGTSTTDVMSQNAATKMIFQDPSTKKRVAIGPSVFNENDDSVAIGKGQILSMYPGVAIGGSGVNRADTMGGVTIASQRGRVGNGGYYAVLITTSGEATGDSSTAIGAAVSSSGAGSIALGAYASASTQGEMNIGLSGGTATQQSNYGYNNSAYRLLTGLYDPQNAHDAATKGYVDARTLTNAGAPTTSTVGTVGQLLEDTTNGKLYICTDTTGGTYTWVEVGAGGGGADVGKAKVLTSADYNWPTNNPTGVALWLLEPGIYTVYSGTEWYATNTVSYSNRAGIAIIRPESSGLVPMFYARESGDWQVQLITKSTGVRSGTLDTMMTTAFVIDDLTSTITNSPLSANQGKVLNDKITPASGSGAPTTSTVGILGKIYIDTSTDAAYMCTKVSGSTYTWKQITA